MKLFVAIITGMTAGVLAGLLFAPRKGTETRRILREKGEELSGEVLLKFHNLGNFINEKLDSTKGVYHQFIRLTKMF